MGFSAVVLGIDPEVAQSLASKLSSHFRAVHLADSRDELPTLVAKEHPQVVVLDMEFSRLADVIHLHQEFPLLPIVCIHRIADEILWIEAIEAGASDVCQAADVQSVLSSVLRNVALAKLAAA